VEWLKVKALSSSPSATKKKEKKDKLHPNTREIILCSFLFTQA
jgi:hypothetical protein